MDENNKPESMPCERAGSWPVVPCPECEERSYLRTLVAELIYRNQVLRFDLMEARNKVERIEGAGACSPSHTKVSSNTLV
jgi:hypothetical protein